MRGRRIADTCRDSNPIMNSTRTGLAIALAAAALLSGCAVYPVGPPVAYGDPAAGYGAPVVVAPAPVYYGPAYGPVYPSIRIDGRFGSGPRHWRGPGWGGPGWRDRH